MESRFAGAGRADGELPGDMVFSADGRTFASAGGRGTVELRDAQTFELRLRLEAPMDLEVSRLAWAPDGSRLYLLARGPRMFFWDLVAIRKELGSRGLDW